MRPHPLSRQTRASQLHPRREGAGVQPRRLIPSPFPRSGLRPSPRVMGTRHGDGTQRCQPTVSNPSPQERAASQGTRQCRGHREEPKANPKPSLPLR